MVDSKKFRRTGFRQTVVRKYTRAQVLGLSVYVYIFM